VNQNALGVRVGRIEVEDWKSRPRLWLWSSMWWRSRPLLSSNWKKKSLVLGFAHGNYNNTYWNINGNKKSHVYSTCLNESGALGVDGVFRCVLLLSSSYSSSCGSGVRRPDCLALRPRNELIRNDWRNDCLALSTEINNTKSDLDFSRSTTDRVGKKAIGITLLLLLLF